MSHDAYAAAIAELGKQGAIRQHLERDLFAARQALITEGVARDAAERALSDAREALRLAQSALDGLMGDTDPYSETPALRAMQAIAAALPAPSTEGDCSALINSVETPPAPVPPGETRPACGEEFWTDDASWARCNRPRGHEGDCYGDVIDYDPEAPATIPAPSRCRARLAEYSCVLSAGHDGAHWQHGPDGIGGETWDNDQRSRPPPAAPAAHPETTPEVDHE